MAFPDFCLRGIRIEKWIDEDGFVTPAAFEADSRTFPKRDDGLIETSIEWEDDKSVLKFCFQELNNVFIHGAVRLPRKDIDYLIKNSDCGRFSYERKEENGDDHHGNFLFDHDMINKRKRKIEAFLAQFSSRVIPPEDFLD